MSTPSTEPLLNWSGNVTYSTRTLHRPGSATELQELVARTPRLRPLGTRHSFSRVADSDGALVSLAGLPERIEPDPDGVTVSAGITFARLAPVLHAHGRALHNLGSLPHISVAGACATGTHGSGAGNPCLAAAVRAVEFVRPDGELVRLARGDADFGGAGLSLGALGVVTALQFDTVPTFDVTQRVWLDASLTAVLDDLETVLRSGYSVSLFSHYRGPVDEQRIEQVWVKTRTGDAEPDLGRFGARPAGTAMHPIAGQDPSACTPQLGSSGPWHTRLPHFRAEFTPSAGEEQQSEFFVASERAADALAAVAALNLSAALLVAEVRTIAADELWLSPFRGRDTVALHFTWVDDDALVADAVRRVEAAIEPFDPRPHWGKVFSLPAERVRAAYPYLPRFTELAARHDPGRVLGNEFLQSYVY